MWTQGEICLLFPPAILIHLLKCITITAHPLSTIWSIFLLHKIAVSGGQSSAFRAHIFSVCHVLDYQCAMLEKLKACLGILMRHTGLDAHNPDLQCNLIKSTILPCSTKFIVQII